MSTSVDTDDETFEDTFEEQVHVEMDDRLAQILERLVAGQQVQPQPAPQAAQPTFKPPEFDGKGDVEFFIRRFQEVSDANGWNARAELLSLRACLKDSAVDCGKADDAGGIMRALRSRYGMSPREARNKLLSLKKDYKTGLQEHAGDVEGLVELAFADLPDRTRQEMALETFGSTLGNAYLQRHLLAVRPESLEEAVRTGNEFLQIRPTSHSGVRSLVEEDEECLEKVEVQAKQVKADPMEALLAAIKNLTKEVEQLKQGYRPERKTEVPRKVVKCWGCGKDGHLRSKCTTQPWQEAAGNARGPQQ